MKDSKIITKEIDTINNQIEDLKVKKKNLLDQNKNKTDKALATLEDQIMDLVAKFNQIAKESRLAKRIACCVADCSNIFQDELVPENWEPEQVYHVSSKMKTSADAQYWFDLVEDNKGWYPSSQEC